MKIWKAYMNSGQYGGWTDELVLAETKQEAIQILKDKYPYNVRSHSFGASEFKFDFPGYNIEIVISKEGK